MSKKLFSNSRVQPESFWSRITGVQKSLLIIFSILAVMPVITVQAIVLSPEATTSADASDEISRNAEVDDGSVASPSSTTTTQLKKRLEKILGDQDDATESGKLAGYIGEVTRVSEEALAVKSPKGNQIIPLDESVEILKRDKPLAIKDISVGNWVIVIGNKVRNGDVSPSKIIVQATSLQPTEHMVSMGTIDSIGKSSVSFIPRGQTEPLELVIDKNSKLIDSLGEPLELKKIPTEVSAIAIALLNKNNTWTVSTLKTLVNMDAFKNSTPTPTATPKAKPAASAKPTPKPSATPTPAP